VVSTAAGCLQMASARIPRTSWNLNWIHTGGAGAAASISGVAATYRALKKKGKLPMEQKIKFLVIGGDGSTYDSGLSAMSGMMERGEDVVYLCYDNQLAAGTGGQASSATPMGAATPTTPIGDVLPGKLQSRKNITAIVAAHKIPYVAQSAPWIWNDLYRKAEKSFDTDGPAFLNVLSPCPGEWKTPSAKTIELTRLASDTCIWPIFEIKNGFKITVNYKPKQKLPVTEWLKTQQRFTHLLCQENKWIVDKIQEEVDNDWNYLLSLDKDEENKHRDN